MLTIAIKFPGNTESSFLLTWHEAAWCDFGIMGRGNAEGKHIKQAETGEPPLREALRLQGGLPFPSSALCHPAYTGREHGRKIHRVIVP